MGVKPRSGGKVHDEGNGSCRWATQSADGHRGSSSEMLSRKRLSTAGTVSTIAAPQPLTRPLTPTPGAGWGIATTRPPIPVGGQFSWYSPAVTAPSPGFMRASAAVGDVLADNGHTGVLYFRRS